MKKLVIVLPHASTGGSVKWILRWIELHKEIYDISVIELQYLSPDYVVHRNKIKEIVPFYPVLGDLDKFIETIDNINPQILYFNELPESILPSEYIYETYNRFETWVTTHSSLTKPEDFKYFPNKIITVCKWQMELFSNLESIIKLWEYPIENKERSWITKNIAAENLGFKFGIKHILNVGLFTPGKNQGELFEIARNNPLNAYHFVGNQAENFRDYWEPLMKNKPDNCIIWGEREDVDLFYQACDELYFCSKFELFPIVIREALSYNLPIKMYKLATYLDEYDYNPLISYIKKEPKFSINYINGCFLEISDGEGEYEVFFINNDTKEVVYKTTICGNCWAKTNIQYFVNWYIEVRQNNKVIFRNNLFLKDKNVLIGFESKSLGDTLAWFPYVEEFRKKHRCNVIVSTFLNNLFKDQYPELKFVEPGEVVNNINAQYSIGWFYNRDNINFNKNPLDPKKQPLQKTCSDILGLEYKEIKPKLNLPNVQKAPIVSLGIHSTAQLKYWNNPNGWQEVVDYLNTFSKPIILSKEEDGYMGNFYPKNVNHISQHSLDNTINTLCKSTLFIGVSSGLSWLAWACNVPVILISGFTENYTEMQDCIRINAPENTCKGCFNTHKLDPSNWNWCPLKKDFECSKKIESSTVIKEIEKLLI